MGLPDGAGMIPRPITDADLGYWGDFVCERVTFAADDPDTIPCPALATLVPDPHGVVGTYVVRAAWQLDEIELAHLATGGTLWVTVELVVDLEPPALRWAWGGLPPHMLEVSAPRPGSVPS